MCTSDLNKSGENVKKLCKKILTKFVKFCSQV